MASTDLVHGDICRTLATLVGDIRGLPSRRKRFEAWKLVESFATDHAYEEREGQCLGCMKDDDVRRESKTLGEGHCRPPISGDECPERKERTPG